LQRERVIGARGRRHQVEPIRQRGLFRGEAQRAAAQRFELRQRVKQQEAADRRRLDDPSLARGAIDQAARPTTAQEPASERSRQRIRDLLRAGMKEFRDLENLPILDLRFLAYACEAARSNLQIRDADRVLIGHAERKLPRGFRQQPPGAVAVLALDVLEAGEPRQEMPGVAGVLIVIEPRDGGNHDRARVSGKVARGGVHKVADRARRSGRAILERRGRGGEAGAARPGGGGRGGPAASPRCAASKPAANAARLRLTPIWPRRIAASNAGRGKGSAPDPASAPNSTALKTLPVASASAA